MSTQTLHNTHATQHHLPEGTDVRGFALYVGLAEHKIDESDPSLSEIVAQIKALVARLAPAAQVHATAALAPAGTGGRDIDLVRVALHDPTLQSRGQQLSSEDRAESGVILDFTRKRVLLDNVPAPLTFREFELLQYLVLREGRTISREELIEALWSDADEEETPNARTIDVHVRRLRVKLEHYQAIVRTVRGIGYRFDRHADVEILSANGPSPDAI